MKGTVKFYDSTKRYGFISAEDGKEYFVHETGLEEGVTIAENDKVEFEVEQGDKGPKAAKVRKASEETTEESSEAEESTEEPETEESAEEETKEE